MKHWYTNDLETKKFDPEVDIIPDGWRRGCHFNSNRPSWNSGKTKDDDPRIAANGQATRKTRLERDNYISWNKGLTKETDERVAKNAEASKAGMLATYGVENPSQLDTFVPWNKGKTKETDPSVMKISVANTGKSGWNKGLHPEGHPHSEESKLKISNTHKTPEVKQKRFDTMKKNGNLGKQSWTKAEQKVYDELLQKYDADDIICQYFDKERYPYICDFYVIPEDQFIEVHGNWTHGGMPFDKDNQDCLDKLAFWKSKAETSDYYKNAIYTWTVLDTTKAKCAKDHNLNFKVIYN